MHTTSSLNIIINLFARDTIFFFILVVFAWIPIVYLAEYVFARWLCVVKNPKRHRGEMASSMLNVMCTSLTFRAAGDWSLFMKYFSCYNDSRSKCTVVMRKEAPQRGRPRPSFTGLIARFDGRPCGLIQGILRFSKKL